MLEIIAGANPRNTPILDRIVHGAYWLELDDPSMRKIKASEELGIVAVAAAMADGRCKEMRLDPARRPRMTLSERPSVQINSSIVGPLLSSAKMTHSCEMSRPLTHWTPKAFAQEETEFAC